MRQNYRNTDPETSRLAAESIEGVSGSQRLAVLSTLRRLGEATDEEIFAALPSHGVRISASGARTRRSELVELGFIAPTFKRRRSKAGREMIVWTATKGE